MHPDLPLNQTDEKQYKKEQTDRNRYDYNDIVSIGDKNVKKVLHTSNFLFKFLNI